MKPPSQSSRLNLNTPSRYNSDPDESPHDSPPDSSSNGHSPYDGDSSLSSRSPPRSFSVAVDEPIHHLEPIHPPLMSSNPRTPHIIRLLSRNAPLPNPNFVAGLRTELLMEHTVILYDDDRPPSDDDQPPGLEPGDDDDEAGLEPGYDEGDEDDADRGGGECG